MATSPFVLPMDVFWQVLAFTILVTVAAPKETVGWYMFTVLMGFAVSVASVIPYNDEAGLALINTQFALSTVPMAIYLLRLYLEQGDRPHLAVQVFRALSPVSGIDPDDTGNEHGGHYGNGGPPQQGHGQQHGGGGQQQPSRGYMVIPDPEQVDADTVPDGESFEDMVDEIDDHRE